LGRQYTPDRVADVVGIGSEEIRTLANEFAGDIFSLGFYPAAKAGRVRGSMPGNVMTDMILANDNPLRAFVVISDNPMLSMGNGARKREAFAKLVLVIVIDIYPSATAEYVGCGLPGSTQT
jgi:anaerobic selenocysteine-containing dehydrogenase